MKHLKILGLAAVAAMALMAFAASSASATALYNTASKLGVGAELDFSIPANGSAVLVDTENEPLDTCTSSTVSGSITNAGGVGATVSGHIGALSWGGCTWTTTTILNGGLEVHQTGTTTNGSVTSNAEIKVTISIPFFGSCVYGVPGGTFLGTLTTASTGAATFDANAIATKRSGSSITCPETSRWTGTYTSTVPSDNLRVEAS